MKKILLGTTALVAAAGLFAGAAMANDLVVKLGGNATWVAGGVSEDLDAAKRGGGFLNTTELDFNVTGTADNGLIYGAEIDLQADINGSSRDQGSNATRTYLFLQGAWGRVEMGSTEGSEEKLKVDASNIASASGGIAGDWLYFATHSTGRFFIVTPNLPLGHGASFGDLVSHNGGLEMNNANKISYFTPRFSGFQAGISFTPNNLNSGSGSGSNPFVYRSDASGLAAGQAGNIVSGGVNWEGNFSGVGIKLGATGEAGQADATAAQDLRAWNAGGELSYMGFSVAGSYGDWSDSLRPDGFDQHYWTAGGAYAHGPWSVSVTYLNSEAGFDADDSFDNLVVGADYALAPGLLTFIEWSHFSYDGFGTGTGDNDGDVGMIGARLNF